MIKNTSFFRYLAYSVEITLLYIFGATPGFLPDLFGAKPCLLIACAVTIAVFESEVPAMVFGLICGVLTDLGCSNAIGTYTILLTLVCFALGYCANNLIMANFWNVMLSAVIVITVIISLHYFVVFVISDISNAWQYYKNHYVSRIIQTIVVTAVMYFVNKFVYSSLISE